MKKSQPRLKILVCYHKPASLVKNEIFVPIHVGRAHTHALNKDGIIQDADTRWLYKHMIGDDTGDNISAENLKYAELTALYWAWKNYDQLGNPEYFGFAHYRRFLIFQPEKKPHAATRWRRAGNKELKYLTNDLFDKYLSPSQILKNIEDYDIYIYERPTDNNPTITEFQWWSPFIQKYIRAALDIIHDKYPPIYASAHEYLNRNIGARCNLMIMKRELFFEYCAFLFGILKTLEPLIDHNHRAYLSVDQQRYMGRLSEVLLGIWTFYKSKAQYRVAGLPELLITDSTPSIELLPAFSERNVAICCNIDNKYALPCAVMLQSIIAHASPNYNYDVVILDHGLSPENRAKVSPPPNYRLTSHSVFTRCFPICTQKSFTRGSM